MPTFAVLEAKTNLSRLIEAVENGSEAEIIIALKRGAGRGDLPRISASTAHEKSVQAGFGILGITAATLRPSRRFHISTAIHSTASSSPRSSPNRCAS